MQIVADANPLISILINPGKPVELLFLESLELVAPSLLFEEIENNKELILRKSKLTSEEIEKFIVVLYLQCPIWSNEKQLKNQKVVKVYATHELIDLFHLKEKEL